MKDESVWWLSVGLGILLIVGNYIQAAIVRLKDNPLGTTEAYLNIPILLGTLLYLAVSLYRWYAAGKKK